MTNEDKVSEFAEKMRLSSERDALTKTVFYGFMAMICAVRGVRLELEMLRNARR